MRYLNVTSKMVVLLMIAAFAMPTSSMADGFVDYRTYAPQLDQYRKVKGYFDDPRPFLKTDGPEQICPKELVDPFIGDVDEMKARWSKVVGFKAPELVGKIAPEIKPGKYTWQEVKQNPGFKALLIPHHYGNIREAGPPTVGAYEEIEVIPTRQFYWSLPLTDATERNAGKTKLDENGYIISETWDSGYPFPRPSGEFKARQILYNHYHRYVNFGMNCYYIEDYKGWDRFGKADFEASGAYWDGRFAGRVFYKPYGFINERARKREELIGAMYEYWQPRDNKGLTGLKINFIPPDTNNQMMYYLPSMRRVRKMSSTDSQDPWPGLSSTYDDWPFIDQKMHPDIYPYEVEVLEEREFLVPAMSEDGAEYISSKEWHPIVGLKFERRPLYVVQMTQVDKNYAYSKRIIYFDKETLCAIFAMNYDQKGRDYRVFDGPGVWSPKLGMIVLEDCLMTTADLVDYHSELYRAWVLPANMPPEWYSLRGVLSRSR